jgi:hypothetical protein
MVCSRQDNAKQQITLPHNSQLCDNHLCSNSMLRYLDTANFLRSVRNFKIDIRPASPWSYMCAIHWQVAQATSLENIDIYMLYDSDVPGNNQQVC